MAGSAFPSLFHQQEPIPIHLVVEVFHHLNWVPEFPGCAINIDSERLKRGTGQIRVAAVLRGPRAVLAQAAGSLGKDKSLLIPG